MNSKVKLFGHPVHPMLVGFPIAFYAATVVCYLVYNSNADVFWFKVAYMANLAGIIMAALAALPGFIDWLFIPSGTRAKKTGVFHLICNVLALVLFTASFIIQKDNWNESAPSAGTSIALSVTGFLITVVAGFLGWALVQKHHVGVDPFTPDERK